MVKKYQLIGMVSGIFLFSGVFFKSKYWSGASFLILLGAIIGIIYMLVFLVKGTTLLKKGIEKITAFLGSIMLIFLLLGFSFKMQHWPGSAIFLLISFFVLLLFSVFVFIDAYKESDANKQSLKILFGFVIFIFTTIFWFLGLKVGVFLLH